MCLAPRDAKLLIRYFDAVDTLVTARLLPDAMVDERHLTSTLRETLDHRFAGFHALSFTMDQLKAALVEDDTAVKVNLWIEAKEYSAQVENRITQADLGLIIRYDNFFRPDESFSKAVLFQAKRLYCRQRHGQAYSDQDRFEKLDVQQLERIAELADRHGNLIYYLFYCPRPEAYDEQSRRALRYFTMPNSHWREMHPFHWIEEYGFLPWWTHVEEYASDPNRHFPGLIASRAHWLQTRYLEKQSSGDAARWIAKPKQPSPTARDVYERVWNDAHALSWFIVYRMLSGSEGSSTPEALSIAAGDATGPDIGIAPRYTMQLRITVGGEG